MVARLILFWPDSTGVGIDALLGKAGAASCHHLVTQSLQTLLDEQFRTLSRARCLLCLARYQSKPNLARRPLFLPPGNAAWPGTAMVC